jgi:hypothetical protein
VKKPDRKLVAALGLAVGAACAAASGSASAPSSCCGQVFEDKSGPERLLFRVPEKKFAPTGAQ